MRGQLCWGMDPGQTYSPLCLVYLAWTHPSHLLSHSITLIVLSSEEGTSELRLERLLQMVFGAMVRLPNPLFFFFLKFLFAFVHTLWHVGSEFPDQGLNPPPAGWKCLS